MEHRSSNPFWAPATPSPAAPKVEGDGGVGGGAGELDVVGGVADVGGSGGGGDGAVDSDSDWTEWGFRKSFLENALQLLHADGDDAVVSPDPVVELSSDDDDDVVEVVKVNPAAPAAPPAALVVPASEVADPVAYNAMLKRKLDEDLAVVACWKASGGGGSGSSLVQNKDVNGISSSSWDTGDDTEGKTEKTGNMSVTAHKAKRRKEESDHDLARCSTSRKQAHLMHLEDQLSDLKVKNHTLLSHLGEVVLERDNYADDCMVLRAKVETLQLKLKMTEDHLARVMSTTTLARPIAAISSLHVPFMGYPPNNAAAFDVSVPIQDAPLSCFITPAAPYKEIQSNSYILQATLASGDLAAASHQLYHVTSMGHVQRTMLGGEPSTAVSHPSWGATLVDQNKFSNTSMQYELHT